MVRASRHNAWCGGADPRPAGGVEGRPGGGGGADHHPVGPGGSVLHGGGSPGVPLAGRRGSFNNIRSNNEGELPETAYGGRAAKWGQWGSAERKVGLTRCGGRVRGVVRAIGEGQGLRTMYGKTSEACEMRPGDLLRK